ncbi:uncharacterized protein LOC110253680 [Exaiptasia diaphana]|uniref:BHLH domain-containing protein n=1 Tax=Exaiptasia diaphana TaxID=2652724 RepID=A0A913Y7C6_EXADI|nr:uncharacterized protein LOC110253680 [Exaiptasia diaphana]
MSLASKYSSNLCLVFLTNDPKEAGTYSSLANFLYANGFTPIEVQSPGQALIQTRQVKFFVIIVLDDDHDLIKKMKSDDGMNADTIVIAVSSSNNAEGTTQELFNQNVIQHVVQKSNDLEQFQKSLIEAIQVHLINNDATSNNPGPPTVFQPQEPQPEIIQHSPLQQASFSPQAAILGHSLPGLSFPNQSSPGHQLFFPANQMPVQQPGSCQSQQMFPSNQSFPLQAFTLIPPMIVPFHTLMQNNGSSAHGNESYMMPRIVDFSTTSRMIQQANESNVPDFADSSNTDPGLSGKDQGSPDSTTNNVLGTEISCLNEPQDKNELVNKLPSFANFLDCLEPHPKKINVQEESHDEDQIAAKRSKLETENKRMSSEGQDCDVGDETKNPLSVLKARPYFMNLDEKMEDIAFDPKVKSSDRHNAKERHRRIRITKATEFFKENIPCMTPNMDKATALHVTVYYIIFLRDALRQMNPNVIKQLHKSYEEEWKSYFEKVTATVE